VWFGEGYLGDGQAHVAADAEAEEAVGGVAASACPLAAGPPRPGRAPAPMASRAPASVDTQQMVAAALDLACVRNSSQMIEALCP